MLRGLPAPRPVWLLAATAVVAAAVVSAAPPPQGFLVDTAGPPALPPPRRRAHIQPEPYERSCVMQGGVCRYASHCPKGMLTSVRGLCPRQRNAGVECCYVRPKMMKPTHHKNKNQWKRNHNKDRAQRRWHQQKNSYSRYSKN